MDIRRIKFKIGKKQVIYISKYNHTILFHMGNESESFGALLLEQSEDHDLEFVPYPGPAILEAPDIAPLQALPGEYTEEVFPYSLETTAGENVYWDVICYQFSGEIILIDVYRRQKILTFGSTGTLDMKQKHELMEKGACIQFDEDGNPSIESKKIRYISGLL